MLSTPEKITNIVVHIVVGNNQLKLNWDWNSPNFTPVVACLIERMIIHSRIGIVYRNPPIPFLINFISLDFTRIGIYFRVPWTLLQDGFINPRKVCKLFSFRVVRNFIGSFGSNAKEPMQSWIVCCVSSLVSCIVVVLHHHCSLWTVILATGLIRKTSNLAHICTCAPCICTSNI